MKACILIALFAFALSSQVINKAFVDQLKRVAPFQVYEVEENPFRDWTREEIRSMLGTDVVNAESSNNAIKINDSWDFRKERPECNLGIRNQLSCGSCWAFAGVQSLQQRFCFKSAGQQKPILSPQDPVSCDDNNMGCNGGILLFHWMYLQEYGVVEEDCFPYTSGEGDVEKCITQCKNGAEWKKYKVSAYDNWYTQSQIMADLPKNGPVETQFNVYSDFMSYKGGIYVHTSGNLEGGHAVVILGYGSENGVNYWICQNSWGENWGENGYFRIKMGQVGIDSNAFGGYPIL